MLLINEVSKRYRQTLALDAVSLEFDRGLHALLAPNGAGKSTLIKIIVTLIRPSSGEVLYDGVDIHALGADYRAVIGYLPQDFGFYRSYTARRFLRYIAALKGIERRRVDPRIDEVLAAVALSEVGEQRLRTFSGGMLQRIGIAQALLNDPRVLVLDEPSAGLDPKERVRLRNLLSSLAADRIVLLSTHIVSDVESIADTVTLLGGGALLHSGTPDRIRGLLDGQVFETTDPAAARQADLLLAERHDDGETSYRILSDTPPVADARAVQPGLEDVFLSVFRDAR